MEQTQIMVPGILVALKTSVNGGVEYARSGVEEDEEGRVKKWETTRLMEDPAERKGANEIASKASNLISRLCVRTSFGLLCRIDREAELDEAVVAMRALVTEWNRKAIHSFVTVSAIKGRIADNDEDELGPKHHRRGTRPARPDGPWPRRRGRQADPGRGAASEAAESDDDPRVRGPNHRCGAGGP